MKREVHLVAAYLLREHFAGTTTEAAPLAALDQVAQECRSTPARVALAWPSITAPIASATTLAQLTDLIEATKLELNRPALERLNQASAWA